MRISALLSVAAIAATLTSPALAQQHPKAGAHVKNGVETSHQFVQTRKGGEEVSCEDFLGVADRSKPLVLSYVLGVNKGRDPKIDVVDVGSVQRLIPVIISTCRSRPHGALRDTVSTVIYRR